MSQYLYLIDCLKRAEQAGLEADRVARELVRDSVLSPQARDKIGRTHGMIAECVNDLRVTASLAAKAKEKREPWSGPSLT